MAKVAFIGLGVMGFPMAGHLKARGGHDVVVYNRSPEKSRALGRPTRRIRPPDARRCGRRL